MAYARLADRSHLWAEHVADPEDRGFAPTGDVHMNEMRLPRLQQSPQHKSDDDAYQEGGHQDLRSGDILRVAFSQGQKGDEVGQGIHDEKEGKRDDVRAGRTDDRDERNPRGQNREKLRDEADDDDDKDHNLLVKPESLGDGDEENEHGQDGKNLPVLPEEGAQAESDSFQNGGNMTHNRYVRVHSYAPLRM